MELTYNFQSNLSHHSAGSVKELWYISFPMMLTALSGCLMLFFNRLILAKYSIHAMNAVAIAGAVCAVFQFGAIAITSIAEIFVGQYNGAGKKSQLGEPVWQMIWFSCFSLVLFLPLAFLTGTTFLPVKYQTQGLPYFQCIMAFSPVLAMISAIASFFIGQGKVKLIAFITFSGNILNLAIGIILVFGFPILGIPSMGTLGTAIATISAQIMQLLVLFFVFTNRNNRIHFGTSQFNFKIGSFWRSIRIGLPNSLGHMIEITAWAFLICLLSRVSEDHVTLLSIGQSILLLFAFASEGLQKGIIAISSNYIGANQPWMIKKIFHSSLLISFCITGVLAIPLLLTPDLVTNCFVSSSLTNAKLIELQSQAEIVLFWIWIYFIFDMVVWILAAILTAAGDTAFIMVMNAVNIWLFAILPIYIFVVKMHGSPTLNWKLVIIYLIANIICFYSRYSSNKWKHICLTT